MPEPIKTSGALPVSVTQPQLPKGGGALTGMGEMCGQAGPDGAATMTIPLPISAGRGFSPSLTLGYNSQGGNGLFGLGWSCGALRISRNTRYGTPRYDETDQFIGPEGELLVKTASTAAQPNPTTCHQYGNLNLSQTYTVTRYQPRIEGAFNRLEYWLGNMAAEAFWLLHENNGNLHMLGKTDAARIYDPDNPNHVAEWLIEESVNPAGDHLCWCYQAENEQGIDLSGPEQNRDHRANRYLSEVRYGSKNSRKDLWLWQGEMPQEEWLFSLIFDYGQRTLLPDVAPDALSTDVWKVRSDPFSRYDYGFELRTHRLCRQVLMFHHFPQQLSSNPTLISRLLLEYDEQPALTLLTAAQTLAYEPDGTVQSLPPVELAYTRPDSAEDAQRWQQMPALTGLDCAPYQLVDLYGEGVPGVLFQEAKSWCYRAPVRDPADKNGVVYEAWKALPAIPSVQSASSKLVDIDGDGQLEWMVASPGFAGFFTRKSDNSWGDFTPFNALPIELFHPQSQFAHLMGTKYADLAMVGPKSVRVYASEGSAFAPAINVDQDTQVTLPVAGRNAREMVVFADMLGSGQQHLCRIRYNEIVCWPNLGLGRFGKPITLSLPATLDDEMAFNPEHLLLADTDGSGTVDILYFCHDRVNVWLNYAGNHFAPGATIMLPEGVNYDRLCQIEAADVQGNGMANLVLSHYGQTPSHWRFCFSANKPWLLSSINNNLGASHTLQYRSSAQEWLDEKRETPSAIAHLPFVVNLLVGQTVMDEVTGNRLSQLYRYRQGVYDGKEHEFRGFGYVETVDTNDIATPVGDDTPIAAPSLTKCWFHCGRGSDEFALYGQPWQGDSAAPTLNPTRLTMWQNDKEVVADTLAPDTQWWMFRALKGSLLRREIWGLDDTEQANTPYSCTWLRMQVRLMQDGPQPIVVPCVLEQVDGRYERVASDPAITHQVQLEIDRYGVPLHSVTIAYPRRQKHLLPSLPDYLPDDAWENTYDEQQNTLRLEEQLASVMHLEGAQAWRLRLPAQNRSNHLVYDASKAADVSYETLSSPQGLLGKSQTRYLGQQNEVVYLTSPPDLRAKVAFVRTAVLNDIALQAYEGVDIPPEYHFDKLGYVSVPALLSFSNEAPLWAVEHNITTYYSDEQFGGVKTQQETSLTAPMTYTYDEYALCLVSQKDGLGNTTSVEYDYRFLMPWRITDINDNHQEVQTDALGRIKGSSVYGTENGGQNVGFSPIKDAPVPTALTVTQAIAQATAVGYLQSLATIHATDMFSWMGRISTQQANAAANNGWQTLLAKRAITFEGYVRAPGWRWATENAQHPLGALILQTARTPLHSVTLTADNYPDTQDPLNPGVLLQQTQIQVAFSDGFGRSLQQAMRVPDGEAWHLEPDGEVDVTPRPASPRWAISGRVEYDNKGQVVRSYQPYFLDAWFYVIDSSMRTQGYSDTLYYDPLGRNTITMTASGYMRRASFWPWFNVMEDENDTEGLPMA
ncbi:SpvB/TcaC N-terminal domain-containing protein [Nissabacter sp. SGAir0207]|uniref:SpvB/TcaC N-terminal domain-containing protein n=1 Tax=Nissabacter sp. SGAir0207 TaxID=2126321 RepID=UPI001F10DCCE|nr:SpvB/TcaC N-terminal domain-containing protein [Nissabacter sp. SGAir0207]